MRTGHRILLIGPWRTDSAAGGCCAATPESVGCHVEATDPGKSDAVAVVRTLRAAVGADVDVQLVDPRNTIYVVPTVYRDARESGVKRTRALSGALRATTPWTLVVDGTITSRAVELSPEEACSSVPADVPRVPTVG